jgi:DNA ligase-1
MTFQTFAKYLQKLEGIASRNEMTVVLSEMFTEVSADDARLLAYLSQGKLGPAYKSPDFGIADKQMLKAFKTLKTPNTQDVEALFRKNGDLGLVAQEIKFQIPNSKSQLNIKDVYEKLWDIATVSGTGSQDKKQQLIINLLAQVDAVSAKYIVKIILGKLRTGFSDMTMLDSLSWMLTQDKRKRKEIENMYNVRADLGEIVKTLKTLKAPKALNPQVGTPVLMAKCERAENPTEIWERLDKCALEYKLDGLRIQAHVDKEVTLFSRGLENVTSMYPDICEGLKKQVKTPCIVEGEMIALDKQGNFLPFQETVQRKRKYDILEMLESVPLKIFLFDILSLGGKSLINLPNQKRREMLEKTVIPGETVKLMNRKLVEKEAQIEEFFQKALKDGTEGIIAKKLDGEYAAGSRDFNWIKYKKSYQKSALVDTLDVVVMGYDEGQGKRAKFGIGNFLAGVYHAERDQYFTVAKIGTGLTDQEWNNLRFKIQDLRVKNKPENYEVSKAMGCDHWVGPKIVVEILADEITKSPMHTSGFALRFPRLVSFRDKKPTDSTTMQELEKMFKLQQIGR